MLLQHVVNAPLGRMFFQYVRICDNHSVCVCVKSCLQGTRSHTQELAEFTPELYSAGDQAGYIVAWSTKLAMYPRIWKWDAISTYLQFLTSFKGLVHFC